MGHTRLGSIPKTKKWSTVVESVAGGGSSSPSSLSSPIDKIEQVAKQTLEAAQGGLAASISDLGIQYTFYLLTQIVLAARSDKWQQRLAEIGIHLSEGASLHDLTTEMQSAIDDYLYVRNRVTDISEMAQQAAGEAVSILAGPNVPTLFGTGLEEVKGAIYDLSTKKGFSDLGQKFFGVFMARFLNFYLSRITAANVNSNALNQIGDISIFNDALRIHCEQSARIVRDFCGEWYSKTEYLQGITLENTSGFIAIALKKLQAELRQQEIDE